METIIYEDPLLTTENITYVAIKTENRVIHLLSVYFEDTQPLEPYFEHLRTIFRKINLANIIIGGDVNAWSTWWGSSHENKRGTEIASFLDELEFHVLNVGNEPTFETIRNGKVYRSRVDITTCTTNLLDKVENWKVDNGLTSSDHNGITFNINLEKQAIDIRKSMTRKYNTKKAKWPLFKKELENQLQALSLTDERLEGIVTKTELKDIINEYSACIEKACIKAIPEIRRRNTFKLPWWSEELEQLKKDMITKKRRIKNAATTRRPFVIQEYLEAKGKYEGEVTIAQTQSWKTFCAKQDRESVWDGIYRVIKTTNKLPDDKPMIENGLTLNPIKSVRLITETFFQDDDIQNDSPEQSQIREYVNSQVSNSESEEDPLFTTVELENAVNSFNPKKAPGADGFTSDICTVAINHKPELFLKISNKCLELAYFPIQWKMATVIVFRKPGKSDYNHPKSYRPIGLLPVLGKILEKMLVTRLKWHLLPKLNPRQYGFVPQRSTEDALYDLVNYIRGKIKDKNLVTTVSLDIEGAFDSAWWPAIKYQLIKKNCPRNLRNLVSSYLENRQVQVRYAGETCTKLTTKGCVQGSIGGPIFWNILLDPLLDALEGQDVYCQGFADDVVLVFASKCSEEISRKANNTLKFVNDWGIKNKLKFAAHKTHAMVLTKKLKYENPHLIMAGQSIEIVNEIKILGLTIDSKLNFKKHISNISTKALNIYKLLSRAAKVSWGLNSEVIRTIYVAVIEPIVLYAASVWAPAAQKIGIQKQLNTIQRGFAQKICKSYRTVSLHSALLLSGLIPLDLRVREQALLYEAKRGRPHDCLPDDRELEQRVSFLTAVHPALEIKINFSRITNLEAQTVEEHKLQGQLIFTDGSKIEDKVGAAISVWQEGKEQRAIKLKLEKYCTVFQAELFAISRAVDIVLKGKEHQSCIFTDSRSSLELLQSPTSTHPLVRIIRRNISQIGNQGKQLRMFWIKAHVGIKGNERADELAKQAALYKRTAADYAACPLSYIKRMTRQNTLDIWQSRYTAGTTAGTTKVFLPEVRGTYKIIRNLKPTSTAVQILTGHGGFGYYLHKFKCKDSPLCKCDPNENEEIVHLLTKCPRFGKEREDLEIELESELKPETLSQIMSIPEKRQSFLKFAIRIAQKIIKENKT